MTPISPLLPSLNQFLIVFLSSQHPETSRHAGATFVEQVLEDSGLSMPFVLLNDGYGSEAFKQIDEIRGFVLRSERAPVELASLRTSTELRLFWERLADPACRLVALEEELQELELSLWHRSLWMACQVVRGTKCCMFSHSEWILHLQQHHPNTFSNLSQSLQPPPNHAFPRAGAFGLYFGFLTRSGVPLDRAIRETGAGGLQRASNGMAS